MTLHTLRHLLAPFSDALSDAQTTEVVVNGPGRVGREAEGKWTFWNEPYLTIERLDAIGILAADSSNQNLSPSNPLVAATLPGGERIQICRPPATLSEVISLTIRKPSAKPSLITDDDFGGLFNTTNSGVTRRTRSDDALITMYRDKRWTEFFRACVKHRKTIGVTGATSSGKTHFLRRILMEIPNDSRIITIEDTAEFRDAGPENRVNLFFGDGRANLTAEDCLKASLRMRPDRIILQEVRSGEAFAYVRALAAGHPGGATSWHAEEGREFDALALMVKQSEAGRAIRDEDLQRYLRSYIDVVVWLARDDTSFTAPRVWFRAAEEAEA